MNQLLDILLADSAFGRAVRARAQAEWLEWAELLHEYEREASVVRSADAAGPLKQAELSFITGDIARSVHWSEGQVAHRLGQARRVRNHTPTAWAAFAEGRIDGAKAREIASAAERLERPESLERLDRLVVTYAERHTVAETRRWLRIFVARVEADLFTERANKQREERAVDVVHGDDGMGLLISQQPNHVLAAINQRLTKEARAFGADDKRTMQQRRADLLAAWMTTNDARQAAVHADIAATLPASALIGADHAPAVSADGDWVVPAEWVVEIAKTDPDNVFWHRMLLDPITDDVLAHEYKGRYAPEVLTKALEFRDGVCQAPGCCRPASACDMDHRIPHEVDGPTTGWNLGPYCRKHHIQKGFGLLDTGPTAKSPPGRSRNTPLHGVGMPDTARRWTGKAIDIIWTAAA